MDLYEAIFARKSVRNYTAEVISDDVLADLFSYYHDLSNLFGDIQTDITIVDTRKKHKDAKVLYEDGQGDGPKLISLDEYANKLSAPDFKSCDQIRMWYDENAGADGTYQILYDDKGYVRQFYDGMFG